jgi:glycolate oxidase iron-sulfur subunit
MSEAQLRALTDACVHCGFCLPACPTYSGDGQWAGDGSAPGTAGPNEMDSPRGRIHLIRQLLDGAPAQGPVLRHLDNCLGCLACVPACPSGVAYDRIIADARVMVEPARTAGDRLRRAAIFAVFPYPRRLTLLRGPLRLAQRLRLDRLAARLLPAMAGSMLRLAPTVRARVRPSTYRPAAGDAPPRAVVGLLTGCVQSAFFSHVSAATARVLAAEGYQVVVPRGQSCCGALAAHTGRAAQARRQARRTVAAFERAGVQVVVTDSAGCGSAMKEYAHLLADDPVWGPRANAFAAQVRDITELLATGPAVAPRHPLHLAEQPVAAAGSPAALTVAYHDACHLSHGQRIRAQPRELLCGIPGLRLVPIQDADMCCGSAGVYNLLSPGPAAALGARKAAAIRATGAEVVVAGNPGCLLQIRAALQADGGPPVTLLHTVELLDASVRRQGSIAARNERGADRAEPQ